MDQPGNRELMARGHQAKAQATPRRRKAQGKPHQARGKHPVHFERTRRKVAQRADLGELTDQALARELVAEGLGPCYVPLALPTVGVRFARRIWEACHPDQSPPRGVPIRLTEEAIMVWDSPRRDKAMWALAEYETLRSNGVRIAEALLAVYRNGLADSHVQTMGPWNINELFALTTAYEEKLVVMKDCSRCEQKTVQHVSMAETRVICDYCSLYTLGGHY